MDATAQLPAGILVRTLINGDAYQLPRRDPRVFPALRKLASVLVAVGGCFAAVELASMCLIFYKGGQGSSSILSALIFAVAGLPFLAIGMGLIVFGLWASRGSCDLELRRESLIITDRLGPLAWRRSKHLSSIRKLRVATLATTLRSQSPGPNVLTSTSVLLAESPTGRAAPIAFGYPSDWLESLGRDLVSRVRRQAPGITIEFDHGVAAETASPVRPEPRTPAAQTAG